MSEPHIKYIEKHHTTAQDTRTGAWKVMKPFVKFGWKAMKMIVYALAGIIKLSLKTYPDTKADHTVRKT